MSIPTIHLDSPNEAQLVETMRHAAFRVGFFYIDEHGIPESMLDRVLSESKALFDLPLEAKEALSDKIMSRGYTAMEEETLDVKNQKKGDTKEGFYISTDISKDDPRYNPAKFMGPNVWPSQDQLPSFQDTMNHYLDVVTKVALRVVRLLALALDLPENFFDLAYVDRPALPFLRLLHYSSQPSDPENGIFACGAHSDYGVITLLLTDDKPGLQILDSEGVWIDVPPEPSKFVVNLGDMLERWSNGRVRSTMHRVITKPSLSGDDRYSIPFFFDPAFDTVVECLPTCTSPSNPPKWPKTTSGEYLINKYKETHADFAPTQ